MKKGLVSWDDGEGEFIIGKNENVTLVENAYKSLKFKKK